MKYRSQLEEIYKALKRENRSIKYIAEYTDKNHAEIKLKKSSLIKYFHTIKREFNNVITITDKPAWKVIGETYIFDVKGETKTFSIELIDKLFLYYSRHGYNFTRLKCQQRFELHPKSFQQIQNAFHLSKDCDTISPYTKLKSSKEELESLLNRQNQEILNSGEMTRAKFDQAVIRKYRKVIDRSNLHKAWSDEIMLDILDYSPRSTRIELKTHVSAECPAEEITVAIADIHAYGKSAKSHISDAWNLKALIKSLRDIVEIVNSYRASKVNLLILGDLVETVSGLNHPDSWKGIEDGMYDSAVIIETKELLIRELINKIVNLNRIGACAGNHDRLNPSSKIKSTGAADLIFHMIGEKLGEIEGGPTLMYDPEVFAMDFNGYGVIGMHGHKGLHKRDLNYLINKFAVDPRKFQFVLSGHYHNFICAKNADQETGRMITLPSLLTGNDYSDFDLGIGALSGFGIFSVNSLNKPRMLIENI